MRTDHVVFESVKMEGGKRVKTQTKEIVANVYDYFEETTLSFVSVKIERGKRLKTQTKEVVANVYDYFEEASRCQRTQRLLKRTCDATEVSCTSTKRPRKEKAAAGGAAFATPTKKCRVSRHLLVDDFRQPLSSDEFKSHGSTSKYSV